MRLVAGGVGPRALESYWRKNSYQILLVECLASNLPFESPHAMRAFPGVSFVGEASVVFREINLQ